MSDPDDLEENDPTEAKPGSAKGLRAALEAANAAKAALESEVGTLKKSMRSITVAEALKANGARPSLAKFYDKDEASPDDVLAWLKENGEDFGWSESDADDTDDTDDDTKEEARRIRQATEMAPQRKLGTTVTAEYLRTASYADLKKQGLVL